MDYRGRNHLIHRSINNTKHLKINIMKAIIQKIAISDLVIIGGAIAVLSVGIITALSI